MRDFHASWDLRCLIKKTSFIQMILLLFYLFFSFCHCKHVLRAKPYHENRFPSTLLVAHYQPSTPHYFISASVQSNPYPFVELKLKTKMLSLNLDNLVGLLNVKCQRKSSITLTVEDIHVFQDSIYSNVTHSGLLLLLNPHWGCFNSQNAQFLYVNRIVYVPSKRQIRFHIRKFLKMKDVIDSYELDITSHYNSHSLDFSASSYTNARANSNTNANTNARANPNPNASLASPFNFSYTGKILKHTYKNQQSSPDVDLWCSPECRIQGSAFFNANIKGQGLLQKVKTLITAGIGSSLDMNVGLLFRVGRKAKSLTYYYQQNFFEKLLMGISIPSILEAGIL